VESYYGIVKQWFTSDAEVETIHVLVQNRLAQLTAIENPAGVDHNHIQANKRFCEFYEEWQRGRSGNADADADAP
jgi:hypothetical protein